MDADHRTWTAICLRPAQHSSRISRPYKGDEFSEIGIPLHTDAEFRLLKNFTSCFAEWAGPIGSLAFTEGSNRRLRNPCLGSWRGKGLGRRTPTPRWAPGSRRLRRD